MITKREVRRLALLIVANELDVSLENSDEWWTHPEGVTDVRFDRATSEKLRAEGTRIRDRLVAQEFTLAEPSRRKKGTEQKENRYCRTHGVYMCDRDGCRTWSEE